ncbi:MAG: HDOD domain-containing protein, partial [Candidatus Thiodiazotropha endolucinida]
LAGMLHDIGKLILIVNQPTEYLQLIEVEQAEMDKRVAAEEAIFGSTHGAVGAYLLGLWGLPQSVVEAVALHNQPALQGVRVFSVLSVVHIANAFVHAEAEGTALDALLDLYYINSIQVTEERIEIWKRLASGSDANSN